MENTLTSGQTDKNSAQNSEFLTLRSKIFAHGEVEIIVVHAKIVAQGLKGLEQ